jgi:hypothetical protein
MTTERSLYQDIEPEPIRSYAELQLRILQLKLKKQLQEEALRIKIAELVDSFSPAALIKDSLHKLVVDRDVQFDVAKAGLNFGADFIFNQLLGRKAGIPVYLLAKLAQTATGALVKKYSLNILSGLRNLVLPRSKQNVVTQDVYLIETEKTNT